MELVNNGKALYTLFLCIGYGVLCGAAETVFSLLISKSRAARLMRCAVDIVGLFLAAVGLFLLSLPLTDGRPRWWLFLGTAAGFFGYKRLLERPLCRLIHWLFMPLFRLFHTIGRLFVAERGRARKNVKKTKNFFKNLLKFKSKLLYNRHK